MTKFDHLDLPALKALATKLALKAKKGDLYLLYGDLGVGKTTFVKSFATALGANETEVSSPTFNLVHVYNARNLEIWHFDLYRLKTKEELFELGLGDALSTGIAIIEWPDIAEDLMPKRAVRVYITVSTSSPDLRDITLQEAE